MKVPRKLPRERSFNIWMYLFFGLFIAVLFYYLWSQQQKMKLYPPPPTSPSPPSFLIPLPRSDEVAGASGGERRRLDFVRRCDLSIDLGTDTRNIFNDPYIEPTKEDSYREYRQVGVLVSSEKGESTNKTLLPLLGKHNIRNRNKYNYYTISNNGTTINMKLPIKVNGKTCTNEYGCDEIFNGDTIKVDGYDGKFTAQIYENNTLTYIP